MKREQIVRAALLAFPPGVRSARGAEMAGTLLDVSSTSRARFAREIVDLVRSGVRARGAETTRAGAARVVGDGFCLAGVWLIVLLLTSDLGDEIHGPIPDYPRYLYGPWTLMLLSAALVLALVGYDRFAGAAALLFTASILLDPSRYELTDAERVRLIVPMICFAVLIAYPRHRTINPRRLVWLAPIALLAVAAGTGDDAMAFVALVALVTLVPASLVLFRANPRPLIACAITAAYLGVHMAQDRGPSLPGLLVLAAAPLVIARVISNKRAHANGPV